MVGGSLVMLVFLGFAIFELDGLYQNYQLQNPIYHDLKTSSKRQLRHLSGTKKAQNYLTTHAIKQVTIEATDNQGWHQYGYYQGQINGKPAMFDATRLNSNDWRPKYKLTKIGMY